MSAAGTGPSAQPGEPRAHEHHEELAAPQSLIRYQNNPSSFSGYPKKNQAQNHPQAEELGLTGFLR